MLKDRVVTALLLLAGLLGAVFLLPAIAWLALCAALCGLAAWEWGGLARFDRPLRMSTAVVFAVSCLMLGYLTGLGSGTLAGTPLLLPLYAISALFWMFVVPMWLLRKWPLDKPMLASLVGFIVLIPTALALAHLRVVGPWVLLGTMAVVWVADIAAYFTGRTLGRNKLAPTISPGKTWEGAMGAVAAVLLYGIGVLVWLGAGQAGGALVIGLALVTWTALSIIGDLFESLLKRQAGLKDSGSILPGHGGILDRIDSLTSTLPIVALVFVLLSH
ncbi:MULTISPECIES: phosphatidate cytidylyltransferase [unclassified Thauera]|uniref:phosphatidate cytidylyltransferase n=1 Tax=unclassified Thauera TaxID=2609274 RepID=UPI0002CF7BF7|nr:MULTISPECIES: phosphatidate cytidylyltransferase [unclassified Thauera]ENO92604.1 phosphatidate cytidylyltransferase [Thauera sp. 28]WBL62550.1 phosphatidate cytidylyltransferase [Thauera sp. WB-2]HAG75495.1 phosphatidate cytidylyltransferase [Thauera sp.]HAY11633.1 phosphatidate cytidylyltransferase [Thauera sp.]HNR59524.1 phosphatidate cytidylyltransferase [Thauera sp.]